MKIKTIIENVGIRGRIVANGTEVDVVADSTEVADMPDGAIRKSVAVGLVERKAAEVVKEGSSKAASK